MLNRYFTVYKSDTSKGRHRHPLTIILKSCLTGKVVWIYQGPSEGAARVAYWRACKKEIERVKNWSRTVAERRRAIGQMISDFTANIPLTAEMTDVQREALRKLQNIRKAPYPCDREFYNHIMELRRRRAEDSEIRRQMREREQQEKKQQ